MTKAKQHIVEYKPHNPERELAERMKIKKLIAEQEKKTQKKAKKKTNEELVDVLIIIEEEGAAAGLTVNQRVAIWKKITEYGRATYFHLKSAGTYYGHRRFDPHSAINDGSALVMVKHEVREVDGK